MTAGADPALDTLLLPFANGALAWPQAGGALFLGARAGWALQHQPLPGLVCEQDSRPAAEALERAGLVLRRQDETSPRHPLVLLLPPRQREQARALFARALDCVAPGGIVVACMPNREGAKSGQADLARLAGPLQVLSKHHCRVFWTQALSGPADPALAAHWRTLDAPRRIADARVPGGGFTSRPGVFAWDRIDAASALLVEHLPGDLRGQVADLGAGWGYLAMQVLAHCPGVTALDLYEADARALELARANLRAQAPRVPLEFHWHDVATGLPRRYDAIVSNPPFHALGGDPRPDLGRAFIAAAAAALQPGGRLWLVANRHLPYEAVLDASFGSVRTVAQRDGFKVIEALRAR
ncbi:class I SAM-dependent methyltransferase [Luteimonas sp. 50]|uniref:Class I SAM-dependent methyltransferase n=1 Tax=Cognatiluteimonas sedimenti TaxID=2927791 RepID=A0ABT0A6J0_9GAMM|nr:class I SAM-dependent methyltransferase [Lysobacter sedimenti]MCJ0826603.1 class I SAM-dependent methyltransferase [Lysobacter sedimenti]